MTIGKTCQRSRKVSLGSIMFVLAAALSACCIDPVAVSPKTSLVKESACTSQSLGVTVADLNRGEKLESAVSSNNQKILAGHITSLLAKQKALVSGGVPKAMQNDDVVVSVSRLLLYQHFQSVNSLIDAEIAARHLFLTPDDMTILKASLKAAINSNTPSSISSGQFKTFFKKSVSPNGSGDQSRVIQYESYYFAGTFSDRFGNKLSKPTLSLTVSDQEIGGALSAFIEAVADDLFDTTPVWLGTGVKGAGDTGKYYPGASANEPSFLQFAENQSLPNLAQLKVNLVPSGCGMTELKAEALNYLSGKAATWAAGESGVILGAFGGANLGLPVALGKISIGDSKSLLTIVQTVLSTTAKRATFEATIPVLQAIDQQNSTLTDIIGQLTFL
jgi:hypothetical protein